MALLAGGSFPTATRLGLAMLAIQASIGSLNDFVDAALDAGRKTGKPIPNGHATRQEAVVIAVTGLAFGVALTWPSGLAATAVALAGAGGGYLYDLRLSRTAWSWLPFALGLPLVPIYAWLGVTADVPAPLLRLVPIGVLAGAGLALANGLADFERDIAGGIETAAVKLGRARAWAVHVGLLLAAMGLALVSLPRGGAGGAASGGALSLFAFVLGAVLIVIGLVLGRDGGPHRRERAWELEALGVAALGAGWVAAVAALG
ncbi:MAG TPA: UbiA family prenyltransferase [Candidatus Limnocylindrales bacterium]|nr:UbiA family prenyltransferase [Candidatus Limnocylindrales bacterium]